MRNLLLIGTIFLITSACSQNKETTLPPTQTAKLTYECPEPDVANDITDQSVQFTEWLEAKFMEVVQRSPIALTSMGHKDRNDEWDDMSREYQLEKLDLTRESLKELCLTFDRARLNEARQLSYDLIKRQMIEQIENDQWHAYTYPFNQMFGIHSRLPIILKNMHTVDNVDDAKAYILRLKRIDTLLNTVLANAENSANQGIQPPKFVYPHVIKDVENILEENIFLSDFKKKINQLDISETEKNTLIDEAQTAFENSVKPAYENIISIMREQEANATTDHGVWKFPDGEAFYAHRLKRMTTTNLTAKEIHELGLSEVARIHNEMRTIMKQVGFEGTLQEFFTHLKTDPKFTFPETDEGRAIYLAQATELIDTMKDRLDEYFIVKPKADLEVRRVEPFREKSAGKAFYNRPSFDGSRPGIYYANLYKMADMPIYQMEALAYHEGIPGHHMHLALTQEMDIPLFQRFVSATAHSEGWGLYSEYLPKEMGLYQDPYSDFGRLSMELWRAARLVVDTAIHDRQWSKDEAIEYLIQNTPNSPNDCRKSIERYIVMPGQATAYKIGMLKILELRADAKVKLGDKFDIREFHDAILGAGAIPLDLLEERVNEWIESKG